MGNATIQPKLIAAASIAMAFFGRSDLSRTNIVTNEDGSTTLHIGPTEPEGEASRNWIPTVPGRAWFRYFRLYSPGQTFLDWTSVLPDIEKAG